MKILVISTFFPPLNSIASLRPYSWAKEWSTQGHDVTVLTMKKVENPTNLNLPLEGFEVIEVDPPKLMRRLKQSYQSSQAEKASKKSILKYFFNKLRSRYGIFSACRMPDFSDLWIKPALRAVEGKGPWEMVVSTAGPYCVHFIAHALKKKQKTPFHWIADYRDPWGCNPIYRGLFPFNILETQIERRLLRHADTITTVSEPLAKTLAKHLRVSAVNTIENGYSPEDYQHLPTSVFPHDNLFRIVYTGSIYFNTCNPHPLFEAIKELSESSETAPLLERLRVLFVGPKTPAIKRLVEKYSVGRWVEVHEMVPREKALAMQRDADALLFLPLYNSPVDGLLTGKLFEYLVAKTPILAVGATTLEASQRLILEANAGCILPTKHEIKLYLREMLKEGKHHAFEVDENVIKRYDRKHLAQRLLELYDS